MAILFLAFVLVPIVEIGLFIQVGGQIGLIPTLAVVVVTALLGSALARSQGLRTLARAREEMARNAVPVGAMADGVMILVAGVLLLTPGFFTDGLGFALLVPPVRAWVAGRIMKRLTVHAVGPGGARPQDPFQTGHPGTIDGTAREPGMDDIDDIDNRGGSGPMGPGAGTSGGSGWGGRTR